MQEQNKAFNYDMATVAKSIGEFSGSEGENVHEWVDAAEVVAKLMGLSDEILIKTCVLGLRGKAKTWGTVLIKEKDAIIWAQFKQGIIARFSNFKESDEALIRFLSVTEVQSYELLSNLLSDARIIKITKGISTEHLKRQMIARVPAGIKSLLLQVAQRGASWEEFLQETENAAWMAFPEKIIGRIENLEETDGLSEVNRIYGKSNQKLKYDGQAGKREWFCHLHGKGDHSTKFCEIVKKLESKGWKREMEDKKFKNFNKNNSFYSNIHNISKNKNPFFLNGKIGGEIIPVLIDTGADVSLVSKNLLNFKSNDLEKSTTKLRSACGGHIKTIGKLKETEMEIEKKTIKVTPYVTESEPKEYMIIGADAIQKNKEIVSKLISDKIFNNKNKDKKIAQINLVNTEDIYKNYKDMFVTELDETTKCTIAQHRIDTKTSYPVVQRNFPIPKLWEREIDQEVKRLLNSKIIQNSESSWASRVTPVRKKSGEMRLCIDYRALNNVTVKDVYPLPRIDELIDELAEAKIFTTLDATSGYYQIEVSDADKEKTAFRWKSGFYEFNRMPFGLCNAPATFQRTMDLVFKDINGKFVIPYLDDIIIYSKNMEEHKKHIETVMSKIKKAGLCLNKKKCKFFKEEIEMLGMIVSAGIVKPDKSKVHAINNFNKPKTIRDLRSFLGLANYCRDFIPKLAKMEAPLNNLLKGETKKSIKTISWNEETEDAFKNIKKALGEETLRYQPNFNKEFILTTDASDHSIGSILSQYDEQGNEKMVYAYSKTMDATQRNYSTTDKELLAIVKSVEHFRRYLLGKQFLLKTDHKALTYIKESKNTSSRMLRWALKLQEYNYRIEYISGDKNGSDGLSRYCQPEKIINNVFINNKTTQDAILKEYHLIAGHASGSTMKFLLMSKYRWNGIAKDIDNYVNKCLICARAGGERQNTMNRILTTNNPNELWECDLIGRIPIGNGKNKFIFMAIDHYTKWVEAVVVKSKNKESIIRCIEDCIIKKHGNPKTILTDCGKEFNNEACKRLAQKHNFTWKYISPYHHKSTGAVERANQTVWNKIKKLSEYGRNSWEKCVEKAVYATNISYNRSIGTSPFVLKYGKEPTLQCDVSNNVKGRKIDLIRVKENIKKLRLQYNKEIQKGKKKVAYNLTVNDKVLAYKEVLGNKLKSKWTPGYKIVKKIEPDAYLVEKNSKQYQVNKSQIKKDLS